MKLSPRMEAGIRCLEKAGVLSYHGMIAAAHTWELPAARPTYATMQALLSRGLVKNVDVHPLAGRVVWVWALTYKGTEVAKGLGS